MTNQIRYKVRIRDGRHYGHDKRYRGGDVVEVTQEELDAFGDKFRDVERLDDRPGPDACKPGY